MTFKWLRYDVECEKTVMWTVADAEGEHVNAQAAIDREAVNAANIATLRAQLAARDAALDAALEQARKWDDADDWNVSSIPYKACGAALKALLLKHGVHPK